MPGEQKPHCAALRSAKANCNSASAPLSDIPSIVSIRLPSACTAKIKQPRVSFAIDQHRACAANAMLAPKMRPCKFKLFAEEISQMLAGFDQSA